MKPQDSFAEALLDPGRAAPAGLTDPRGRPAGRRFDIYRNNVVASLTATLAEGFPVLERLLGPDYFRAMAGVFVRAHPPEDARLQIWGGRLPGFLARFEPLAHLPYLPDVARLELGLRQSYHAADAAPLRIAGRAPGDVLALRPRLAPPTLILQSRFPVLSIWRRNTAEPGLAVETGPETVLIARASYDPRPRLLPEGGLAFARHLKGRLTLAEALTAAQSLHPDADAAALLTLFLEPGLLTLQEGH